MRLFGAGPIIVCSVLTLGLMSFHIGTIKTLSGLVILGFGFIWMTGFFNSAFHPDGSGRTVKPQSRSKRRR